MNKLNPFVKSGHGILEYELVKLLHQPPHVIGRMRRENPDSILFCELAIIEEFERKEKAYKEAERKAKRGKVKRR